MRIATKLAATTLAAAALFGILGLSPAAAAAASTPATSTQAIIDEAGDTDPMATANVVYHRGFTITNTSRFTLTLVGFQGDHVDDQLPPLGTVVRPGEGIGFQIAVLFLRLHEVTATFEVTDDLGHRLYQPYTVLLCVDQLTYGGNLMIEIPAPMKHTGRGQTITVSDDPAWTDWPL